MKNYDHLKLENQICFPLYSASRLLIREYQPFLDELGITYPQYLVLLVLWENDNIPVNDIAGKLILNTNTITPLLKRMESAGIIKRVRSAEDERKVIVSLTDKGKAMREEADCIPQKLIEAVSKGNPDQNDILRFKEYLTSLIDLLTRGEKK